MNPYLLTALQFKWGFLFTALQFKWGFFSIMTILVWSKKPAPLHCSIGTIAMQAHPKLSEPSRIDEQSEEASTIKFALVLQTSSAMRRAMSLLP